jgi:hypothetical protein
VLAFAAAAAGQYPGQYPPGQYPPGQGPPGQGPGRYPGGGGGSGIPMPRRGSQKATEDKQAAALPRNFSGVIRELNERSFELETTDTRILTIQFTDKTVKPDGLKTGAGVDVEATQNPEGLFQAVTIKVNTEVARKINPSGAPLEPEEERTGPPPTILVRPDQNRADADEPPKLKRGKPAEYASNTRPREEDPADAPDTRGSIGREPVTREPAPPAVNPRQVFIEKARMVASTFVEGLPNYICQELTTRYASETRVPSWNVIDTVSAEVVYENGKESYRNLAINGKATKKSPEDSGAWSTGEFGTILANLFASGTDASFKYVQDDTIAHRAASVYDFQVTRPRSSWKIRVPGQYILPAYKGSVWIDKESGHALRIEMQAKDIPEEFPRISVETAVDFEYISLGTPDKFLLPVHAEVLSCARGSNACDRNVIEFRNYHKFSGESTIKFNQ